MRCSTTVATVAALRDAERRSQPLLVAQSLVVGSLLLLLAKHVVVVLCEVQARAVAPSSARILLSLLCWERRSQRHGLQSPPVELCGEEVALMVRVDGARASGSGGGGVCGCCDVGAVDVLRRVQPGKRIIKTFRMEIFVLLIRIEIHLPATPSPATSSSLAPYGGCTVSVHSN
jgi:hypothetical protein